MAKEDRLEELAQKYRHQGYEVKVRPKPDELPSFLAGSDVLIFALRGDECLAVHPPSDHPADDEPEVAREPDRNFIRALLGDAQRLLDGGSGEASILSAWAAVEAGLRRKARDLGVEVHEFSLRGLIEMLFKNEVISQKHREILHRCYVLRAMASHGYRPDSLAAELVQSLIDAAWDINNLPSARLKLEDSSQLRSIRISPRIARSHEIAAHVYGAAMLLEGFLDSSARDVSAEWDFDITIKGEPIVTLRLSDATGAVTGTFSLEEISSWKAISARLNRLWGDLLEVRNHHQLEELAAKEEIA